MDKTCLRFLLAVCFLIVAVASVKQYSGVDVSEHVYIDGFQCLKNLGYDFAIVRCYHSYGAPDTEAPHTVANAHAANVSRVDVYMFPCPTCSLSPQQQVKEAVDYLAAYQTNYTGFWFDIEGGSDYWYSSHTSNQQFFEGMVQQAKDMDLDIGVYTSASQWNPIMGEAYTGGSQYPVWYAHYDDNPSFSDWEPFGGWENPAMKQYSGDDDVCGYNLDVNWSDTMDF